MKISVVIPAYNEEDSLPETIRAVLAQDHPDYEVIVVDNASTDRTPEVAGMFPVKVVHEARKGLLWAREAGRLAAVGEIIANIDADCLPDVDWLSRAVVHFDSPRIIAVSGPYDYYDGGKIFRSSSLLTQRYVYKAMSAFLQAQGIKGGAVLIGGNNLIRASVLEKAGGYNTDLTFYGEDTDTAKRVSKHGRIVFSPKLSMKTSARRFKAEGTVPLMLKYWYHFFKHTVKRRHVTNARKQA
jgi:glycosyltransferase involved in cell wall biosynthesis